ncbi:hypothetical protein [Alloprevotella tannerae]|uniref:DUF551 domain-containing protein n=1 Tax=Alloprevotella tannerae TaxID=76122 RepID=A0A929WZ54_9BACT|nr:hypothetical protein [Alloprevotella tannerae]MBF0969491.1 hypothetical protein [Alloprevotella tannerae]
MTREEKIKEAAQKYVGFIGVEDKISLKDAFKIGAKWADEYPANSWHSVADGDLPNKDGRYLTLHTNGIPCIHAFNTQYRRWVINAYQSIVKYWMEIPQLPKKCSQ